MGTHSSNNSPASPTHQPAKFPLREGWVSGFRGSLPLSQALELLSSTPAKRRICFTERPSWGQLLRFPTCGAGSVPRCTVPSPCPSGLQVAGLVAPPLNPPRRLGLEGLCEKKACLLVLTRMCGAHLRANLDGDSNGLGSWLHSPLWSLKARAAAPFYVFIFPYFL